MPIVVPKLTCRSTPLFLLVWLSLLILVSQGCILENFRWAIEKICHYYNFHLGKVLLLHLNKEGKDPCLVYIVCLFSTPLHYHNDLRYLEKLVIVQHSKVISGKFHLEHTMWYVIRGNPTNLKQEEVLSVFCNFEEKWYIFLTF